MTLGFTTHILNPAWSSCLSFFKRWALCLLFAVGGFSALQCQTHAYTKFTVDDGLPTNYVYGAMEDDDGFIWAYTENGICKFDGQNWEVFNKKDGLPANDVFQMVKDKEGRLWMSNIARQACFIKDDSIHVFEEYKGIPWLLSSLSGRVDYNGYIYFDESKNQLIMRGLDMTLSDSLPNTPTENYIYNNREDLKFIHNNEKLIFLKEGIKTEYFFPEELSLQKRYLQSSQLWESDRGLHFVHANAEKIFILLENTADFKVFDWAELTGTTSHTCMVDVVNNNLVFTNGSAIIILNDKGELVEVFKPEGELAHDFIHRMFIDSHGNYWVGTKSNGLILYKNSSLKTKRLKGLKSTKLTDEVFRMAENICVLTDDMELYTVEGDSLKFVNEIKICAKHAQTIQYHDKAIILNTDTLLQLNSDLTFSGINSKILNQDYSFENSKLEGGFHTGYLRNLKSYYYDNESKMTYISSSFGLFCLDEKERKVFDIFNHTIANYNIAQVIFKNVFSQKIYSIANQTVFCIDENRPDSLFTFKDRVRCVSLLNENELLVGTENDGLHLYKFKENESVQIFDLPFIKDLVIVNSVLYAASSKGVLELNLNDYSDFYIYDYKDGLFSKEINNIYVEIDKLYAATSNGLHVIDLKERKYSEVTSIPQFTKFQAGDKGYDFSKEILLEPKENNIRIDFLHLDYSSGTDLIYQYRLLPAMENWNSTNERFVTFSGLNYGDYELELRVQDAFGNEHYVESALQFELKRNWWESVWSWIGFMVLAIALVVFINSRRFKKKQQKYEREEATKRRMNSIQLESLRSQMNPHFIFNSLGSIQYYIQTNKVDEADEYLGMFANLMRRYLDSAVESFISIENEIALLSEYTRLEKMRFEHKFEIEITCEDDDDLTSELIPSMIIQPFVENAINHGLMLRTDGNGELKVHFFKAGHKSICEISDNSVGIGKSTNNKHSNHKSRGVQNVSDRVQILKDADLAEVEINVSNLTNDAEFPGTTVQIIFNAINDGED